MKVNRLALMVLVGGGIAGLCVSCSTQATVSGLEISDNVVTNAYDQVRFDGCFWKNDLWEFEWQT